MSEVKVNKISPRTNCGTVTVGDSGDSVSVSAGVPVTVNGDLKSNALKATDGGSIISQSGTTITLGASGDTISLASGASQTGFGRTGTVDWDTTPKTANFNAVSGDGFFCNTTSGAFTATLPSGAAGAIVSLADYAATWDSNNLTVSPQSGEKIGGVSANVVLDTKGQSVTFVYVDSTQGWINTMDSTSNERGTVPFLTATGGTITTSGDCKIHTFTGPGTFCVSAAATCTARNEVSYMVIAGGGGGGAAIGGGGGAGGYRESKSPLTPYTASPLDGRPSAPNRVTVTATAFPITVGGGGDGGNPSSVTATKGSNSIFSTITSAGGGAFQPCASNMNGGSGSGGGHQSAGGSGNTPPTTPPQGNNGGSNSPGPINSGQFASGGGGGAGGTGTPSSSQGYPSTAGPGGAGTTTSINASPVTRAGGGGGGAFLSNSPGSGGSGGGGAGAGIGPAAASGTANTGGGGGGGAQPPGNTQGGNGGSGIVIIRYKYQ